MSSPTTPRGVTKKKSFSAGSADDSSSSGSSNVKVMTRVRLFNDREINASKAKGEDLLPVVRMKPGGDVELHELYKVQGGTPGQMNSKFLEGFSFDECFWSMPDSQATCPGMPYATQQDVYVKSGAVACDAAFAGFNSCIFAYGQTGSGKTYTMLGCPDDPGVCPRIVDDLYQRMTAKAVANANDPEAALSVQKCELELTFYEIYNEQVRDLFNPASKAQPDCYEKPKIAQGPFGVQVQGLARKVPNDAEQGKRMMVKAMGERTTAPTKMNNCSSRSHAVFQLHLTQIDGATGTRKRSTINLVDLAGSEKLSQSEAEGLTAKQAIMINKSLFALRSTIDALVAKKAHIPLRESILTFTLSDALGGNSKTTMIAAVSPHVLNLDDSKHTLQYAMKAKKMVTKPTVNEESSEAARLQQAKLIEELKRQLADNASGRYSGQIPEGVVPMTSVEVMEQIKEQEEKFQAFVVEADEMKEVYKQKEVVHKLELEKRQREMEKAKVEAKMRKQEQFRRAFTNAFKITVEKKTTASLRDELKISEKEKAQMSTKVAECEAKVEEAQHKTKSLRGAFSEMEKQFYEQQRQHDESDKAASFELEESRLEAGKLQSALSSKNHRIAELEHQIVKLTSLLESGKAERDQIKKDWEEENLKHQRKKESLRNAATTYKHKSELEETRVDELRSVFSAQSQDHKQMLDTILAQQRLMEQQEKTHQSRRAADNKDESIILQELLHYKQIASDKQGEINQLTAQLTHYEMSAFEQLQRQRPTTNSYTSSSPEPANRRGSQTRVKSPSASQGRATSFREQNSPPSTGREGGSQSHQHYDPTAQYYN